MVRPWIETAFVLTCVAAGWFLGRWFGQRRDRVWLAGYFAPLFLVTLVALAQHIRPLEFTSPFCWIMAGRTEFVVMAFAGTMVLATPMSRLPQRRVRILVLIFLACIVFEVAAWPFLAPAFNHRRLGELVTRIDSHGICLQNTDYTCGPAAAVTALRRLGLPAEEGALAQVCGTNSGIGTPPDILAARLERLYRADHLQTEYRAFKSIAELAQAVPVLAIVKFRLFVDHYVTVLEVTPDTVTIGDPLSGKETLSHTAFAERWRHVGVVLRRSAGIPARSQ